MRRHVSGDRHAGRRARDGPAAERVAVAPSTGSREVLAVARGWLRDGRDFFDARGMIDAPGDVERHLVQSVHHLAEDTDLGRTCGSGQRRQRSQVRHDGRDVVEREPTELLRRHQSNRRSVALDAVADGPRDLAVGVLRERARRSEVRGVHVAERAQDDGLSAGEVGAVAVGRRARSHRFGEVLAARDHRGIGRAHDGRQRHVVFLLNGLVEGARLREHEPAASHQDNSEQGANTHQDRLQRLTHVVGEETRFVPSTSSATVQLGRRDNGVCSAGDLEGSFSALRHGERVRVRALCMRRCAAAGRQSDARWQRARSRREWLALRHLPRRSVRPAWPRRRRTRRDVG